MPPGSWPPCFWPGDPRTRPAANRCWPLPRKQRAEHSRVPPCPQRGSALRRADPVRTLRWPRDRHGNRHPHGADPGLGQPQSIAGGNGREHGGLALGPLIAGLFAQYAPNPTVLVFEVYLAALAVAGLCLFLVPETVSPRRRPTVGSAGLAIPERGRGEFVAAGVAGFAAFSLLGLFSALTPTLLQGLLHVRSHTIEGAVVFLIFGVATVTLLLLSRFGSRQVVMAGLGLFLAALALIVAALSQAGMALFLAGTVVGGIAVGAVFLGSLATANSLAPTERRGQTVSTYFVLCYAGLTIPVVGVGVASGFIGDFSAVLALSILLAALCMLSMARIRDAGAHAAPQT